MVYWEVSAAAAHTKPACARLAGVLTQIKVLANGKERKHTFDEEIIL